MAQKKLRFKKETSNREKLLVLFLAAEVLEVVIDYSQAFLYALLLKKKKILSFSYSFEIDPSPFSKEMSSDMRILFEGGYINMQSPVKITLKGNSYIKKIFRSNDINRVEKELRTITSWQEKDLFNRAYAALSF